MDASTSWSETDQDNKNLPIILVIAIPSVILMVCLVGLTLVDRARRRTQQVWHPQMVGAGDNKYRESSFTSNENENDNHDNKESEHGHTLAETEIETV